MDEPPEQPAPPTASSEAQVPEAQAPEAQAPQAQAPEAQVPEAQVPEAQAPEAQAPEAQVPEAQVPEAQVPEAQAPEAQVPVPEAQAPEAQPPEAQVPEAQVPAEVAPPAPPDPRLLRVETLAELVRGARTDRERQRRLDPLRVAAWAGFTPAAEAMRGLGFTPPAPADGEAETFLGGIPGGKAPQVVAACAVGRAVLLVARRGVTAGWVEEDAATLAIEAAEAWLDSPSGEGELATLQAADSALDVHEKQLNAPRLNRQPGDAALEVGYATRAAELAARAAYAPSEADARGVLLAQLLSASQALINPDLRADSQLRWMALKLVQLEWILPAVRAALIEWALRPRGT